MRGHVLLEETKFPVRKRARMRFGMKRRAITGNAIEDVGGTDDRDGGYSTNVGCSRLKRRPHAPAKKKTVSTPYFLLPSPGASHWRGKGEDIFSLLQHCTQQSWALTSGAFQYLMRASPIEEIRGASTWGTLAFGVHELVEWAQRPFFNQSRHAKCPGTLGAGTVNSSVGKTLISRGRFARLGTSSLLSRQLAPSTRVFTRLVTNTSLYSSPASQHLRSHGQNLKYFNRSIAPSFSHAFSTKAVDQHKPVDDDDEDKNSRKYAWIDEEARVLIAKAYKRHNQLADKSQSFPPSLSVEDLEKIGTPYHFKPQDFVDRMALGLMRFLRVFVHGFFREKYDHHAVCLETVAAVPGLVGGFHRHLRSLRNMKRDHGWINVLQEEAENERMHLLIFMKVCKPTVLEKGLVVAAQGLYLTFYSALYLLHQRAAHRLTGYLEEEAHRAYTDYLASIDSGKIPNRPAPAIAKDYYRLPENALMRDVILHVRADEAMHRDVNHHFGNKYGAGDTDSPVAIKDQ